MKQLTVKLDRRELSILLRLLGHELHRVKGKDQQRGVREDLALALRLSAIDKADDIPGFMWQQLPAWADEALWAALKTAERVPALEGRLKEAEAQVKSLKGQLGQAKHAKPAAHKPKPKPAPPRPRPTPKGVPTERETPAKQQPAPPVLSETAAAALVHTAAMAEE